MSYCRWSCDNWQCDLYCYEDVAGGWTTHVAGRKPIGVPKELPFPFDVPEADKERAMKAWLDSHDAAMKFLETAEYRDIDLPHAGDTFNDPTLQAFKERLLALRALGYSFPDHVLETVDQEIADAAAAPPS
jgi:hypothetical protein